MKTNAERRDFDAESDHQADAPFWMLQGNVAEPGYCVHNLYDYVRSDIKANPLRIKEWDFYQITDERYTMQMTIGTLSYGGMSGVTLFDRQTGERFECNDLALLPFDKYHLPDQYGDSPHHHNR